MADTFTTPWFLLSVGGCRTSCTRTKHLSTTIRVRNAMQWTSIVPEYLQCPCDHCLVWPRMHRKPTTMANEMNMTVVTVASRGAKGGASEREERELLCGWNCSSPVSLIVHCLGGKINALPIVLLVYPWNCCRYRKDTPRAISL